MAIVHVFGDEQRPVTWGDIVRRGVLADNPNDFDTFIVGKWPGSGNCTLTNLFSGENEGIPESSLNKLYLLKGRIELENLT